MRWSVYVLQFYVIFELYIRQLFVRKWFLLEINWLCVSVMVATDSDDRDRRREGGLASALTPSSR